MHTDSNSVTLGSFLAEGTLSDFAEEMAMNEDEADGRSRDLAIELGITSSSLSDWLNGCTVPSLENGLRIQRYLARKHIPRGRSG
jgi:hypothetical protein